MTPRQLDLKVILDSLKAAKQDKEMYFWYGRLVQWGYDYLKAEAKE